MSTQQQNVSTGTGTAPINASGPSCGHSACSQNYIETGEEECIRYEKRSVSVTLYLTVDDAEAFAQAAVARAIEEGVDADDAASTYTADALTDCARMLFDPGISPPGCEILDSSAEDEEYRA